MKDREIDNWLLTPSQLRKSYQGGKKEEEEEREKTTT